MAVTSEAQARQIAAQWQSPGTIGRVLAAYASGVPVSRDALWLDIDQTLHHDNPQGQDRAELEALREWVDRSPATDLLTNWEAD
jgi:hypothetical protein